MNKLELETSNRLDNPAPDGSIAKWTMIAGLVHAAFWVLGPTYFIGSMHLDTVEVASWASHWALGYAKHPPLIVWLFKLVIAAPGSRIVNFLLLSQTAILLTCWFIWLTIRLFASHLLAMIGVLTFLASPSANSFAAQVNHNTISMPFAAAALFFGIRFLERRIGMDAVLLGVFAGLGLLAKYQVAFYLLTLVGLATLVGRYRSVWFDARGYTAVLICFLVVAPHVWWDHEHDWRTILYASSDRPMRTLGDAGVSLNELLDGLLMCAVGPVLIWVLLGLPRPLIPSRGINLRIGLIVAGVPVLAMVILAFGSGQILRQGWLVPQLPALAIGLALIFSGSVDGIKAFPGVITARAMGLSCAQISAFALFLFVRAAVGEPVEAYSLDARTLTFEIEDFWRAHQIGPVRCLLMPNRSYGLAAMLFFDTIPTVENFSFSQDAPESSIKSCEPLGGLLLLPESDPTNWAVRQLNLESRRITVPSWPWTGAFKWAFKAYYIPTRYPSDVHG